MESIKILIKQRKRITNKINDFKYKTNLYNYITLFIIINILIFFLLIRRKKWKSNLYNNNTIQKIFEKTNIEEKDCQFISNELNNRIKPFEYENELSFFACLISCKIPFSFIRFGDGEEYIMRGINFKLNKDNWSWNQNNQKFRESLIESSSICLNPNNFIGIPCKTWNNIAKSILSFSKCETSKYISYTPLFINNNYPQFKEWINRFLNSPNRWKIILVANSIINKDISWAYKYFSVPDHIVEIWDEFSISFLSKLSAEAKQTNLIFFVSAGPAANIIISKLIKINNKNIYIDFGSSIEYLTKGYSTRSYPNKNSRASTLKCKPFLLKNKKLIFER